MTASLSPFQERLVQAMAAAGHAGNRSAFARALGYDNNPAQVAKNWFDRDKGLPDTVRKRLAGMRLSLDWINSGEGELQLAAPTISVPATRPDYVRYQVMGEGGAGPGMINTDYPEVLCEVELAEWQVRQKLGRVPSPSRVKLLTVRGESMSPRIRSGDVVFVDVEDQRPYDGGMFVIVLHGHALVKRIEIRTDGLHIVSLASPERPDIVPPDRMETLRIAGRVLGAIQLRKTEDF